MSFRSLAPLSIGRVVHRLPRRYVARPLSTSGSHGSNEPSKDQDSVKAKLQSLWKNYGMLAITTYLGIYGTTLGTMFFALDNGLLSSSAMGIDHIQAIQKVCDLVETLTGNTSLPGYIRENPRVGTFAVAWVMTKFTEPMRLAVTVAVVPSISKFLKR